MKLENLILLGLGGVALLGLLGRGLGARAEVEPEIAGAQVSTQGFGYIVNGVRSGMPFIPENAVIEQVQLVGGGTAPSVIRVNAIPYAGGINYGGRWYAFQGDYEKVKAAHPDESVINLDANPDKLAMLRAAGYAV